MPRVDKDVFIYGTLAAQAYNESKGQPSPERVAPAPDAQEPPQSAIEAAIAAAMRSPCRSQRGVSIFREGGSVVATGFNRQVAPLACDGSAACKARCRETAIHAEQDALLKAPRPGSLDLLHVKVIDGVLVASGGPSCAACSKLIAEAGIVFVWLYSDAGWTRYDAQTFHRLSCQEPAEAQPSGAAEDPRAVAVIARYEQEIATLRAALASAPQERDAAGQEFQSLRELLGIDESSDSAVYIAVDDLMAKLSAAEQERDSAQAQIAALTADIATVLRWARPADGMNKTDPADYNAATAVIDRWAASTLAADTPTQKE